MDMADEVKSHYLSTRVELKYSAIVALLQDKATNWYICQH